MGGKYWDDMEEFMSIHERVKKLFHSTDGDALTQQSCAWSPPFDIYETEKEFLVKADIPAVDEEDVSISTEDNVLIVKGQRRPDTDAGKEFYHCMERNFGRFMRSFFLPDTVDFGNINATLIDGVLTVTLPKGDDKTVEQKIKVTF